MLLSSLRSANQRVIFGYAVDDSDLSRRLAVELIVDGLQIAVKLADEFSRELSERQIGDACYGFSFALSEDLAQSAICIEARLANGGAFIGAPVILDDQGPQQASQEIVGEVRWEGGLRLSGWVGGATTEAPTVQICIDNEIVVEDEATGWRNVAAPAFAAVRAFDITLPRRYADGRAWRASVVLSDGRELNGSPVSFVAFDSGLASVIAGLSDSPGQRLQGALFDQLVPQSMPFALFSSWKTMHPPKSPRSTEIEVLVALFDGEAIERTEASLRSQTYPSWSAGVIPAASNGFSFDADALHELASERRADARCCVFLLPGVELEPDALVRIAACFDQWPDLALLYWDFSMTAGDGGAWPIALPALDYLRLLEQGYFAAGFALNPAIVEAAVAVRVDNVFRLANIGFDHDPGKLHVRHLPEFLSRAPGKRLRRIAAVSGEGDFGSPAGAPPRRRRRRRGRRLLARLSGHVADEQAADRIHIDPHPRPGGLAESLHILDSRRGATRTGGNTRNRQRFFGSADSCLSGKTVSRRRRDRPGSRPIQFLANEQSRGGNGAGRHPLSTQQ